MKRTKYLQRFIEMCIDCLTIEGLESLVARSDFQSQLAFHKVHERFLQIALDADYVASYNAMCERYPFVKVGGKWQLSNVKLFLYLMAARPVMLRTKNADMLNLFDAVQESSEYLKLARHLDKRLTPNGVIDYEDYQNKLTLLYEEHKRKQLPLLEKMRFTLDKNPRSVIRG